MFRLLLISFIALRAIACPVLCAAGGDVASAIGVEKVGCCGGHEDSTPCNGEKSPLGDEPCDGSCFCQVTPELNNRTVSADILLSLDVTPLSLETLDLSTFLGKRCIERHSQRFDLLSGRDVRLVYASLLL